jgi:hypothetical protein
MNPESLLLLITLLRAPSVGAFVGDVYL